MKKLIESNFRIPIRTTIDLTWKSSFKITVNILDFLVNIRIFLKKDKLGECLINYKA